MARIRTIKPEFFRHEGLYEAEVEDGLPLRVAFAGLWTATDRAGRFEWAPRKLKLDCLPYDDVDFSRVLHALWTRGFIEKYTVDGKEFGFIPSWETHQIINNREKESDLPEPNKNNTLTREARVDHATVTPLNFPSVEGKGREGKGRDISTRQHASSEVHFEKFKSEYPRRDGANPWKPARDKFDAVLKRGVAPEIVIGGATAYRRQCERTKIIGTDKVAQAQTWLNQERWGDYTSGDEITNPALPDRDWRAIVARFKEQNLWTAPGPEPDCAGCHAPPDVLREFGYLENVSRETLELTGHG